MTVIVIQYLTPPPDFFIGLAFLGKPSLITSFLATHKISVGGKDEVFAHRLFLLAFLSALPCAENILLGFCERSVQIPRGLLHIFLTR
jgi:hypothetical protein